MAPPFYAMYLVIYIDTLEYWLIATLHPSQAEAEARFEELLRRFVVADGEPMPPRHEWSSLIETARAMRRPSVLPVLMRS